MASPRVKLKTLLVPKGLSESYWKTVSILFAIYSFIGLILGGLFALMGFVLLMSGVFTNTKSLFIDLLGLKTQITDFPPGIGFLIAGIMLLYISRFSIKEKD